MEEDVLAIITQSLTSGIFPQELKTAIVKPLLKKIQFRPTYSSKLQTNLQPPISQQTSRENSFLST